MKYNRPPSVRSPTAAAAPASNRHSQFSLDEMPDFHMLESNMSLYSNLSNMTGLDTKPAASTTATGTDSSLTTTTTTTTITRHSPLTGSLSRLQKWSITAVKTGLTYWVKSLARGRVIRSCRVCPESVTRQSITQSFRISVAKLAMFQLDPWP